MWIVLVVWFTASYAAGCFLGKDGWLSPTLGGCSLAITLYCVVRYLPKAKTTRSRDYLKHTLGPTTLACVFAVAGNSQGGLVLPGLLMPLLAAGFFAYNEHFLDWAEGNNR